MYRKIFILTLFSFCFLLPTTTFASTIDWSCTAATTAWATGSNWVGGVAPADDTSTDIARFNCTSYTSQPNAGTRSVAGIIVGDGSTATASLTISTTALTIGSSGIDIKASTGSVTLNNAVTLGTTQTWTSASSNTFTVGATVSNSSNNLTISGTGNTSISGIIGSGAGSVTMSGTGTLTLSGVNTFTGGLTIKSGTVSGTTSVKSFGDGGTITIGDTSGSSNATLNGGLASTFAQPITIASGNTGTSTITCTAASTFSGAITMNNNLTLASTGALTNTFTGGITGTGDLTFAPVSTSIVVVSTLPINIVGTISSAGSSSNLTAARISGGVGSNVTTLRAQTTGLLISTNPLTVNSSGTTLVNTNTTLSSGLQVSGGITGTGNLTLNNIGPLSNGININTTSLNNTGTVTNISASTVNIGAVIGTNVTGFYQSGSGTLALGGTNTFNAPFVINAGIVSCSNISCLGNGSNTVTLGDTSGSSTASLTITSGTGTISNPVTVASGSSGTKTITTTSTTSGGIIFSGAIALNDNFTIALSPVLNRPLTISGGITGTGNLTLNTTSSGTMTISTTAINNSGTITITGAGSGTTNISATIGSNVTGIIHNSASHDLSISGGISVNSSGTTLTNSSGTKIMTVSGGITGTGNLTLNNNSSTDNGVTINTTAINNVGTITNSGSGIGIETLSGIIGSNVTGLIQNSATSKLVLAGTNSYTVTTTITSGTLSADGTSALGDGSSTNTLVFNGGTLQAAGTITSPSTRSVTLSSTAIIDTNGNSVSIAGGISGSGGLTKQGSGTLTLSGTTEIGGSLLISTGTLVAPSSLSIGGDFTNNDTFSNNSGTVVIDGTGTSIISGATTFNNFTSTVAGKIIQFTGGQTFGVSGVLTLSGITASSTSATPWVINHQGTESVDNTTLSYASCDASSLEITLTNSTDSGNNGTCWIFFVEPAPTSQVVGNGSPFVFSGQSIVLPNSVTPRYQIVYPDGRVVYLDEPNNVPAPLTPSSNITLPSFPTSVTIGKSDTVVKTLQQILNKLGYTVAKTGAGSLGNETTFFGTLTLKALQKFQCDTLKVCSGTPTTTGYGRVGPRTLGEINRLLSK